MGIISRIAFLLLIPIVLIGGCTGKQAGPGKEPLNESEMGARVLYEENESSVEQPTPNDNETERPVRSPAPEVRTPAPSSTATTPEQIGSRLVNWTKEDGVRIGGISSCTLIKNGEYWMYYTGKGIEMARSSDGLNFVRLGRLIDVEDIVGDAVDMVTNPAVFETSDGTYRMLFEGSKMLNDKNDRKLYSAVSSDGSVWTVEAGVRFQDAGDGKPGELFTSVPDVIRLNDNGTLRMYYTRGATSATALSGDEGLTWTKEVDLDLTRKVAIDPDIVLLDDGTYKLFFTTFGGEFGVGEQWVLGATSSDGINFVLDEGILIEPSTPGGLITDPDVVRTDKGYRMYYAEFKKGKPGELYGQEPSILSAFSPTT